MKFPTRFKYTPGRIANYFANFVIMKKSFAYLPENKQRDLRQLTEIIRREIAGCEMIILFGSYARDRYVDYDQRTEFGVRTYFMSDYDILILTEKRIGNTEHALYSRIRYEFFQNKAKFFHTRPEFINESIGEFNHQIEKSRYFFTEVKEQGVMLYDSGRYKLARRHKLDYSEIRDMAQEYFDDKFKKANSFLYLASCAYKVDDFCMASFQLHQAAENFLRTIPMVFTLYGYKEHDLEFLTDKARTHTLEVCDAFPRNTSEEERLFKLLQDAYVQARYNKNFAVTKDDTDALTVRVERLRDITEKVCKEKIAEYERRNREE